MKKRGRIIILYLNLIWLEWVFILEFRSSPITIVVIMEDGPWLAIEPIELSSTIIVIVIRDDPILPIRIKIIR